MKNFKQFSLVSRNPICFSSGLTEFKISSTSSSLKMSGISPLARRSFLGKYWVIGHFRPIRILSGNFRLFFTLSANGHVWLIRTFLAMRSFGQLSAYCTLSANWVVWATFGLLHTFGQLGHLGNFRLNAHFRPIVSFGMFFYGFCPEYGPENLTSRILSGIPNVQNTVQNTVRSI